MAKLSWDLARLRTYEFGLDRGVFYPQTGPGVAWPGLIKVDEIYSDRELEENHIDGIKYRTAFVGGGFSATITAFSTPAGFGACEGRLKLGAGLYATHQLREPFGFSYRTKLGNTVAGSEYGYKIHVIYQALAFPASREYVTRDSNAEAPIQRSWDVRSVPYYRPDYLYFQKRAEDDRNLVQVNSVHRPVSHMSVSSPSVSPESLAYLEAILYGTDTTAPELPTPSELIEIVR